MAPSIQRGAASGKARIRGVTPSPPAGPGATSASKPHIHLPVQPWRLGGGGAGRSGAGQSGAGRGGAVSPAGTTATSLALGLSHVTLPY